MRKSACLLISIVFFSACAVRKVSNSVARTNNERVQRENAIAISQYKYFTANQYIERFKAVAVQEMNLYGIPASITLAQGLFESGNGNSELAKVANNHFGIKAGQSWRGRIYYRDDDNPNDIFRVYNIAEDSFRDHSEFLKKRNYAGLFELDKNDYRGWAYGLKKAGYATNPKYPALLIGVIEKYNLDKYDQPEGEIQKIKREDRVLTQIEQKITTENQDTIADNVPIEKLYIVKQGDTLYSLSKRYGLTVDEIKALNNMANNDLRIGQRLIIAK